MNLIRYCRNAGGHCDGGETSAVRESLHPGMTVLKKYMTDIKGMRKYA